MSNEISKGYKLPSGRIVLCSATTADNKNYELTISFRDFLTMGNNTKSKPLFIKVINKFCEQNNIKITKSIKHQLYGTFIGKGVAL